MDAAGAHGGDGGPVRVRADIVGEILVDRDDDLRVPGERLLQRHVRQTAAPPTRHVAGAHDLKRLDVDRAGEPRTYYARAGRGRSRCGAVGRAGRPRPAPASSAASLLHGPPAP